MKVITDLQEARKIIKKHGEPYQHEVVEMLRGLTYNNTISQKEKLAQKVIDNMELNYALDVANVIISNLNLK